MDYYGTVEKYYDSDAQMGFEQRANENHTLQRIRDAFREVTVRYGFADALEIGCGPGFDVAWFASRFPDRQFRAIDISAEMVKLAAERLRAANLHNAEAKQGTERNAEDLFGQKFDMAYVYFGALNTVEDLDKAAADIYEALRPGGHAVLTFVNKWYLREMLVQLIKLRFRPAFARIRKVWGGYSVSRFLPSHCYTPSRIRRAFRRFRELEHRGFSIVFPAWYNHHKVVAMGEGRAQKLWATDQRLNKTPFWKFGEYTLFVFQKPA